MIITPTTAFQQIKFTKLTKYSRIENCKKIRLVLILQDLVRIFRLDRIVIFYYLYYQTSFG